jgi:hypothetical protein
MANSKLNELLNSVVVAIGEIAQEHKENSNSLVKQYNELRSNMKIEHDKQEEFVEILSDFADEVSSVVDILCEDTVDFEDLYEELCCEEIDIEDYIDEDEDEEIDEDIDNEYICQNCGQVVSEDEVIIDKDGFAFCCQECVDEFNEVNGDHEDDEDNHSIYIS